MKSIRTLFRALGTCFSTLTLAVAGPRDAEWAKVAEAREKQQPKTAIELLAGIEKAAFADGAWAEGTRALATRIAQEAAIKPEAAPIRQLEAALDTAPEQARPVLRVLAANWMAGYYESNRWRFMRRSSTATPAGDDLETWDLTRILTEIDARLQRALADVEALKKTPVADFAELLEAGSLGDDLRPTMFDFVAHVALEFYAAEEVTVSRPQDSFDIAADSPVFGTADEFLAWKPEIADVASPKARALKLFQDLLAFHRADADRGPSCWWTWSGCGGARPRPRSMAGTFAMRQPCAVSSRSMPRIRSVPGRGCRWRSC